MANGKPRLPRRWVFHKQACRAPHSCARIRDCPHHYSASESLYPDLEEGLEEAYGLDSAYVVDISAHDAGVAQILGVAAARCLSSEFKGGPVLGVTV